MYMSQHRFTPVPEKLGQWIPYNRNYLTLTSRAPGAVLSRIMHIADEPQTYFAVGLWTDKDSAIRWSESAESKLGAKPSQDLALYEGYPMDWSRWALIDFAWGLRGRPALDNEGVYVRHAVQEAMPADLPALERANRAALSLMARRPGFISGETYRGHRGDRLLTVLTFEKRKDSPFVGDALPPDLGLVLTSAPATSTVAALNCTLFQCVWGPDAAALDSFIQASAAAA
jgi:hypothetical protein